MLALQAQGRALISQAPLRLEWPAQAAPPDAAAGRRTRRLMRRPRRSRSTARVLKTWSPGRTNCRHVRHALRDVLISRAA
eukprot:10794581-Alexandrium_andersonii.AAC.1